MDTIKNIQKVPKYYFKKPAYIRLKEYKFASRHIRRDPKSNVVGNTFQQPAVTIGGRGDIMREIPGPAATGSTGAIGFAVGLVIFGPAAGRPFHDITQHVVEAEGVGRQAGDRKGFVIPIRGAFVAIGDAGAIHTLPVGCVVSGMGGELPFFFRGQSIDAARSGAQPIKESLDLMVVDINHRAVGLIPATGVARRCAATFGDT